MTPGNGRPKQVEPKKGVDVNLDMRPPGVHAATKDRRYTPVVLAKSGVVGFVGITQKGPTNEPVRVTSLDQFRRVFGALKID